MTCVVFRQLPQRVDEALDRRRRRGRAPGEGFDGNGRQLGTAMIRGLVSSPPPPGVFAGGSYGNPQVLVELGERLTTLWLMRVRWGSLRTPGDAVRLLVKRCGGCGRRA